MTNGGTAGARHGASKRPMRRALAAALVGALGVPAMAQAGQGDPPMAVIEYSSAPMIRNAALADAAVRVIERGADWLVDKPAGDLFTRKSTGGIFARVGQTWFNGVVEGLGAAVVHEYGHAARVAERGGSTRVVIRLSGSFYKATGPDLTPSERLSISGGGIEGTAVLAGRVGDRVHARGTATPGELTLLVMDALNSEVYILKTLSESRLSSPQSLFEGGAHGLGGDPAGYVFNLAAAGLLRGMPSRDDPALFAETQSIARRVRRASLINFIDYELAGAGFGLARDFIWLGNRQIPVRWIELGPVSVSPGLRYMLSPNGPERQVRTRFKAGARTGQLYVRWSDVPASASTRLLGAGGDYQLRAAHGFVPKVAVDLWRNTDGRASARSELSTRFRQSAGDRLVMSAALGIKGAGYLQGYPLASGAYFNLGAGFRF